MLMIIKKYRMKMFKINSLSMSENLHGMNKLLLFFIFFLSAFFMSSCQKADDNGDLGGLWKLMEIEYVADGSKKNLSKNSYFMAVQLKLMEFRGAGSHYARFQHQGDSLFIQMIGGDATEELLDSFGMDGQDQRFFVNKMNRKKLIIESRYSKLFFDKF